MPLLEKKLYRNTLKQFTEYTDFCNPHDIIESWDGALTLIQENLEAGIKGLRSPQLGAIYAALAHWSYSNTIATVVMPTGTGKTETMLSVLIQTQCPKLLVIVPTDPLREQIAKKFISLGLLKQFNILNHNALHPIVGDRKSVV